jgi:predicted TIM-barrel fold metal-dependent hydrolase
VDAQHSGAVPFSAGVHKPSATVPAGACDCHVHVYDPAFPVAAGAKLTPPPASADDYRLLQQRLGTTRVVLVTPSTYGTDNRCMLAGLRALGPIARGVAVLRGDEPDHELLALHAAGVRGVRANLSLGGGPALEGLPSLAARIAGLGWHLQLLMAPDLLCEAADTLKTLAAPLVFDHFARVAPVQPWHAAHRHVTHLLERGRAWIKLSGGYLVSPQRSVDDPGLDALARSSIDIAPERVVWGSDWPHATASAGVQPMPDDAAQIDRLAAWARTPATLKQVLVTNPERLYGFPAHS